MSAYFYAGIDVALVGEGNIDFTVTETGGAGLSKNVVLNGRYFLTHEVSFGSGDAWDSLAIIISGELSTGLSAVYNVVFSQATGLWTISASGGGVTSFAITFANDFTRRVLGRSGTTSGALSYVSDFRPWYQIIGENGGITAWEDIGEVDEDLQVDLVAYDGSTVDTFAKPGAAKGWICEVPWEPREAIWMDHRAASSSPLWWTWEHWFPHLRRGHPLIVQVAGLTAAPGVNRSDGIAGYASARRCAFKPVLAGGDYLGHASIPLGGYYLAKGSI